MKLSVRRDRPCGTLTAFILLCGVHACWNGVHALMRQQLPTTTQTIGAAKR